MEMKLERPFYEERGRKETKGFKDGGKIQGKKGQKDGRK